MMRNNIIKTAVVTLWALFSVALCLNACEENPSTGTVPSAITLSADELVFTTPAAASLPMTVEAPNYPKVSGLPDWVTVTDGTYQDYKITFMFSVTDNPSYADRTCNITVESKGTLKTSFKITQWGGGFTDSGLPDNNAVKRMHELGLGWNLGNQLDAYSGLMPSETAWGNPKATRQTFDQIKSAGFTCVRIPVTWLGKIGPAPTYTIDSAWMERVKEVVEYAHSAGLQAIINTHHDENH